MHLLTLALLLVMPWALPTDKDKKKAREQYYKYEREDVSIFREEARFTLPDPPPLEFSESRPVSIVPPADLGPRFTGGQRVVIDASPRLEELVARDRQLKQQVESIPGFRIHIYGGTGRQQALDMKRRALGAFPEITSYLDYLSPNYVVRIGDFIDRDEAVLALREVRATFPGAFLVTDQVKVPRPDAFGNGQD